MKPLSLSVLLVACSGSSYPNSYSDGEKVCFDYGAEICEALQAWCSIYEKWLNAELTTEEAEEQLIPIEEDKQMYSEYRDSCDDLESYEDAYFSGAIAAGCELSLFNKANSNSSMSDWGDESCGFYN
jgi:hypothetical protein